jgi:hypothetical protein
MKTIYNGKYLRSRYEANNSLFIQNWIRDINIENFKSEMLAYTELYKQYRPKYTLWLQKDLIFVIDIKTQIWLDLNVINPCIENGCEKIAFVVSKDIMTQIGVMDSLEKMQSPLIHEHFLYEKDARDWLLKDIPKII